MFFSKKRRKAIKRNCLSYVCCTLLLSTVGVVAAEPADQEYTFDEVVVTATKIEQPLKKVTSSVSVITQEMIQNSTAKSVSDLLPMVPGVAVSNNYGGLGARVGIAIRGINGGADSQKMLILIDGRPANGAFKGTVNWNTIPLSSIERIEVVRGPASVLYGNNAFGGAVNIITKKPEKDSATFTTSYGSWGTQTASLYQEGKNGKLGYSITADYGKTNGFRDHSDYEGNNFTSRFDVGDNLSIRSGYTSFTRTNPGTMGVNWDGTSWNQSSNSKPSSYNPWDQDRVKAYYFDIQQKFNLGKMPSQLRVYYNETDSDNIARTMAYVTPGNPSTSKITYRNTWSLAQTLKDKTTGVQFQQNIVQSDKQTILWGSDYQYLTADNVDYTYKHQTGIHTANTSAIYLQDNQQLSQKLRMDLGARYDHHSVYGGQFNPKFGLAYQAQTDTIIRMNIARAFMAPSMNDLYYAGGANPNLKPERLWSYELGVDKQFTPTSKASITFYKENISDMIRKPAGSGSSGIKQNVDSARPDGVELEWIRKVSEHYDYFVNYTYLDMGLLTKYASKHKGNFGINYKNGSWKASLMEEYVGTSYDDDLKTNPSAGTIAAYAITNLKLTYAPRPDYELSLGIDNMFNKFHEDLDYEPLPGRCYTFSLKTKL